MNPNFRKSLGMAAMLAMLAGPALADQDHYGQDHGPQPQQHMAPPPPHMAPPPQHDSHMAYNNGGHHWAQGQHYSGGRTVVTDWDRHHLRHPPAGYEWVQSDNQFVLIAISSGIIASIIANQ